MSTRPLRDTELLYLVWSVYRLYPSVLPLTGQRTQTWVCSLPQFRKDKREKNILKWIYSEAVFFIFIKSTNTSAVNTVKKRIFSSGTWKNIKANIKSGHLIYSAKKVWSCDIHRNHVLEYSYRTCPGVFEEMFGVMWIILSEQTVAKPWNWINSRWAQKMDNTVHLRFGMIFGFTAFKKPKHRK